MNARIVTGILIAITVLHLFFRLYTYRTDFLTPFASEYWQERYYASQWFTPDSKQTIGDDGLYTYLGWQYITGKDAFLINPEVPPLSLYIIGAVTYIFHNQNIYAALVGILVLIVLYLLNVAVLKNKFAALIPVFLFSLEPLFYEQLRATFLDTLFLLFLLLALLFALRKNVFLTVLFLGCFASTKLTYLVLLPVVSIGVYYIILRNFKLFKYYLVSLVVVPVVILVCYTMYFLSGNTVLDYIALQRYVFNYYLTGAKTTFIGMVFPMLFTGTWYTWWGQTLKIREWVILWPLATIGTLVAIPKLMQFRQSPIMLIIIWIAVYGAFLLVTPVWPRYLLLLLPFMYNVTVWVLLQNTRVKSYFHSS